MKMSAETLGLLGDFAQFLSDKLGVEVWGPRESYDFTYFDLDLTAWRLSFPERTPCIEITERHLVTLDLSSIVSNLESAILANRWQTTFIFLVLDVGKTQDALEEVLRVSGYNFIFLYREKMKGFMRAKIPHPKAIITAVARQVELSALSPYETSSPVVSSKFFNRTLETRKILSRTQTNFLALGARRIGKTSLLLEARRLLTQRAKKLNLGRILYVPCNLHSSLHDYVYAVTTELDVKSRDRVGIRDFPNFLRVSSHNSKQPITILLDEIDTLIKLDRETGYRFLALLKSTSDSGYCRYLMAGHNEAQQEISDGESPFYNFANVLILSNFNKQDIKTMVCVPMGNLGITIRKENDVIGRIEHETGGHPNFVQYYCHALLELVDKKRQFTISPDDLPNLYGDDNFISFVTSTFESNANELEKLIVYSFCKDYEVELREKDIYSALVKKHKLTIDMASIRRACRGLVTASIFSQQGPVFRFSVPALPRVLTEYCDLRFMMKRAREDYKRVRQSEK